MTFSPKSVPKIELNTTFDPSTSPTHHLHRPENFVLNLITNEYNGAELKQNDSGVDFV